MSNSMSDVAAPQRYTLCEVQHVTPEVNRAFGTVTQACGVILEWGGSYLVTSVLGRGRNGQNGGKGAHEEKELLQAEGGRTSLPQRPQRVPSFPSLGCQHLRPFTVTNTDLLLLDTEFIAVLGGENKFTSVTQATV